MDAARRARLGDPLRYNGDSVLAFFPGSSKAALTLAVSATMKIKYMLSQVCNKELERYRPLDFGVGDDVTTSRAVASLSPRDNVVLELGIFMGALGRARTLVVRPRGVDLEIPSGLLGLNVIDYDATAAPEDLSSALGPVCLEICRAVSKHGPR